MTTIEVPNRPTRYFVDEHLIVESWEKIESYFENLLNRNIHSLESLEKLDEE